MSAVATLPDPARVLDAEDAAQAFADILDARVSEEAIAAFLIALSDRGETAIEIAEAAKTKGVHSIDAPVSGGDVGAREARLSIMIGGDAQVVEALNLCWQTMGKTIVHLGGPGAGQHTKMANQIVIASTMIGVCEALLYGHRAGLDLNKVLEVIGPGAAGSWSLNNLGPRIIKGNFDPGFFVEHFIKDMGIALDEARRMRISLPGLALANQLYVALAAQGHARDGTQALELALAKLSGIDWNAR